MNRTLTSEQVLALAEHGEHLPTGTVIMTGSITARFV
jgi:2-keto-4-pentenoate hydratase